MIQRRPLPEPDCEILGRIRVLRAAGNDGAEGLSDTMFAAVGRIWVQDEPRVMLLLRGALCSLGLKKADYLPRRIAAGFGVSTEEFRRMRRDLARLWRPNKPDPDRPAPPKFAPTELEALGRVAVRAGIEQGTADGLSPRFLRAIGRAWAAHRPDLAVRTVVAWGSATGRDLRPHAFLARSLGMSAENFHAARKRLLRLGFSPAPKGLSRFRRGAYDSRRP
jgi:hypothetical protein